MYSFTTGSQLHLDSYSIFKYLIPPPPQIVGPQEPPLVLPQRPKHQLSSHRAHRGPRCRRHDSPALALFFLQVGWSFYSFYSFYSFHLFLCSTRVVEHIPQTFPTRVFGLHKGEKSHSTSSSGLLVDLPAKLRKLQKTHFSIQICHSLNFLVLCWLLNNTFSSVGFPFIASVV